MWTTWFLTRLPSSWCTGCSGCGCGGLFMWSSSMSGRPRCFAMLCSTAHAAITLHVLSGDSLISPWRQWKRRFHCPIVRSTRLRVVLPKTQKDAAYVNVWIWNFVKHEFIIKTKLKKVLRNETTYLCAPLYLASARLPAWRNGVRSHGFDG